MRTPKAIGTNHNILQWARKNAGYSVSEVAKKMDKKTEVITSWENGEDVPTFKQLSKLSKIYHYPSAFFFAQEVPEDEPLPSDYRTLPDHPCFSNSGSIYCFLVLNSDNNETSSAYDSMIL